MGPSDLLHKHEDTMMRPGILKSPRLAWAWGWKGGRGEGGRANAVALRDSC